MSAPVLTAKFTLLAVLIFQVMSLCAPAMTAEKEAFVSVGQRVALRLDEVIRASVTSSDDLRVEIMPSSEKGADPGAFEGVRVFASGAVVKGLRIETFDMAVGDMVIDAAEILQKGRVKVLERGTASIALEVKEIDINSFLTRRAYELRLENPKVKFLDGSISMSGKCKWWLVDAAFETTGRFDISKGVEVHYSPDNVALSNMDMPRFVVTRLIRKVNPLMTLDGFPFEIVLKKIELASGWLRITGGMK